jgi:hypothetical protein
MCFRRSIEPLQEASWLAARPHHGEPRIPCPSGDMSHSVASSTICLSWQLPESFGLVKVMAVVPEAPRCSASPSSFTDFSIFLASKTSSPRKSGTAILTHSTPGRSNHPASGRQLIILL